MFEPQLVHAWGRINTTICNYQELEPLTTSWLSRNLPTVAVCQYKGNFQAPLVVFLQHDKQWTLISRGFLFRSLGRNLEERRRRLHYISLSSLNSLVCAEESDCPVAAYPAHKRWLRVPYIISLSFKMHNNYFQKVGRSYHKWPYYEMWLNAT